MISPINITSIIISNTLGFMMLVMLLLNSTWKLKGDDSESKLVVWIIGIVMFMCIDDPLAFYFDGRAGILAKAMTYICNNLLFFCDMLIGPMWVTVLTRHMTGKVTHARIVVINIICALETLLLIINFFVPIVFYIDENNRYQRGPFYFIYMLCLLMFLLDAVGVYLYAKRKGGSLKFFPIFQFLIPFIIGTIAQLHHYGISLIWPAGAVSICGVLLGFQNEAVYRDGLTGLYNRYYLDRLKRVVKTQKNANYTIAMLDLNGFKSINDRFGHAEGDLALKRVGEILNEAVGRSGNTIRYAGDEFIIVMNTQKQSKIDEVLTRIRQALDKENTISQKAYRLEFSIGVSMVNMKEQSLDDIMRDVDSRMYDDKKRFYAENPRYDRRIKGE